MSVRTTLSSFSSAHLFVKGTGALGLSALLVLACNGRLAVLDPPITEGGAGNGSGSDAGGALSQAGASGATQLPPREGPPVVSPPDIGIITTDAGASAPSPCTCGSTELLMALGCGDQISGHPAISDDGRTIGFDLCDDVGFCEPYVWRRGIGVRLLPRRWGFRFVDLTRDGQTMLITPGDNAISPEAARYRVDNGNLYSLGMRWPELVLKADGDVFGLYEDPDNVQLARMGGGDVLLGILPYERANVDLVSASDSDLVVGAHRNGGQLFRWTTADGLVIEPDGWPRITNDSTLALSRDGSSLAAYVSGPDSSLRIVRVRGSSVTDVATSGPSSVSALALSADGAVLAGSTVPASVHSCVNSPLCNQAFSAFRWTEAGGVVELTPGVPSRTALLSSDGSLIVGWALAAAPALFTWTAERGARSVQGELEAAGVDLSGWLLDEPYAATPDGRVVVGQARCGAGTTIYRLALPGVSN